VCSSDLVGAALRLRLDDEAAHPPTARVDRNCRTAPKKPGKSVRITAHDGVFTDSLIHKVFTALRAFQHSLMTIENLEPLFCEKRLN
jgi:hypothetical protein